MRGSMRQRVCSGYRARSWRWQAALGLLAIAATSCMQAPRPAGGAAAQKRIAAILRTAPGAAQPSAIVAADIALSLSARKRGIPAALAEFRYDAAADKNQRSSAAKDDDDDIAEGAFGWNTRRVWMSCDGEIGISDGRFQNMAGQQGYYVSIWKRQQSGDYRLVHHAEDLDKIQPARGNAGPSDEIIVKAADIIQGYVADCTHITEPAGGMAQDGWARSRDRTLRWQFNQDIAGKTTLNAEYRQDGDWRPVAVKPR